jgi:aspartyl-tRNA(Asn)/glutamyl-tRNA(Gln) amidotransferase subunit A
MSDIAWLPLSALSRLVEKRQVSPVEIVQALLDRIDRHNGVIRSYITVCSDRALDEARLAEREIGAGRHRGPLHGLPIAHKDVSMTRGVRTTAHSRVLLEFTPDHDATHVARLAAAGMILLGKTNTNEFACGTSELFGVAHNPWDVTKYAGGSSGGSANALAAGLAVAATGSDTGGSIRVPSCFCGIVGLKPTYGRVSRYGLIPLSWTMDHIGPMARSVSDCALLLSVMAGHDAHDPTTAARAVPDFSAALDSGVSNLVLGVARQYFCEGVHPEVETAVAAALRELEAQGARVEPVDLPHAADVAAASRVLSTIESFAAHADSLRRDAPRYGARARQRIAAGAFYPAGDYQIAVQVRELWIQELSAAFERVHALVMPTVPFPAFDIETHLTSPPDTGWGTRHFNFSGHPAVSLPCGFTGDGLPIGLQIVGRWFDEATLFRIAHAYEQAAGWRTRRPALDQEATHASRS